MMNSNIISEFVLHCYINQYVGNKKTSKFL